MSEQQQQQYDCIEEGDILEEIIRHVPLVDLVWANTVSSSWRSAISSSLLRLNTPKPWLILHSQSTRSPSSLTTLAYDPRSNLWINFKYQHNYYYFSHLRSSSHSSHSSLLYMLSPSKFAFSLDPLHLHWHQPLPPPITIWHPDPMVAALGNHIILVSSGSSTLIPDTTPPPLQIYNTTTRTWEYYYSNSIPTHLLDSASSTSLSVAADPNQNRIYASVKTTGLTYSFDPITKCWCGPYDARAPDMEAVFYSAIGYGGINGILVAVGLIGEAERVRGVVLWEVMGSAKWEMPVELMEKLKGDNSGYMPSVSLNVMGDFAFVHNPLEPTLIIVCQFKHNCESQWGCVTAPPALDHDSGFRNLVLSCSNVTLAHLEHAFKLGTQHFSL